MATIDPRGHECHCVCDICSNAIVDQLRAHNVELEAKLETEREHTKFLGELLKTLYGDKWETLTIHEAKKHSYYTTLAGEGDELRAKLARLVAIASHAYSEWDGGSHEEAIVAMRQLKAAVDGAKGKP